MKMPKASRGELIKRTTPTTKWGLAPLYMGDSRSKMLKNLN